MATPFRRTLAALGAAMLSLAVLALTSAPAWAQEIVDSGGPGGASGPVAPVAGSGGSGGTSVALVVGIIIATALVALGTVLIALRTNRARLMAAAAPGEPQRLPATEVQRLTAAEPTEEPRTTRKAA